MSARERGAAQPSRWREIFDHPPPIRVVGGLRAKSTRGDIGETWWSRRFVAALEAYYTTTESRLARGRSYARAGQVVRLDLEPGLVSAVVQGSRPEPYAATLRVRVLSDRDWKRVEIAMAARAVFLARLLAAELPNEIEEAFEAVNVSLFPARRGDLRTRCSCPDDANPCKHVAAVCYLLAESFDADPFLMFAWRGRPRERLIAELRALRPVPPTAAEGEAGELTRSHAQSFAAASFWTGGPGWREIRVERRPTNAPDALLRDMEPEVEAAFGPAALAALRAVYVAAARAARARLDPEIGSSLERAVRGRRR